MVYWLTINGAELHQGMARADADQFASDCARLGATVSVRTSVN